MSLEQPSEVLSLRKTESGRIFMIGAGASLLEQEHLLPLLANEATWAVNHIIRWLPFTPTWLGISERRYMNRHGIKPFMGYRPERTRFTLSEQRFGQDQDFQWVAKAPPEVSIINNGFEGFKRKLGPLHNGYCSVTNFMQLAAWMGYRQFYLIGNEFTPTGSPWDVNAKRQFDESLWREVRVGFRYAEGAIKGAGGILRDCTPNGRLTSEGLLEYLDLETVLNGHKG